MRKRFRTKPMVDEEPRHIEVGGRDVVLYRVYDDTYDADYAYIYLFIDGEDVCPYDWYDSVHQDAAIRRTHQEVADRWAYYAYRTRLRASVLLKRRDFVQLLGEVVKVHVSGEVVL